jgi:hypothetical protein
MSRTISSTVLPIQQAMAGATPTAWRDGLVLEASGNDVSVAVLDGSNVRLRLFDAVELDAGAPVAYHPVAEVFDAGVVVTTARGV